MSNIFRKIIKKGKVGGHEVLFELLRHNSVLVF